MSTGVSDEELQQPPMVVKGCYPAVYHMMAVESLVPLDALFSCMFRFQLDSVYLCVRIGS